MWLQSYVCLKESNTQESRVGDESMHEEHEDRTVDCESAWLNYNRLRAWDQSTLIGWALNITSGMVFKD